MINYNGIRDLNSCLDSILKQDYPDLEVLLIDNASSDGSTDILKNFVSDQNKAEGRSFRLLSNSENLGFSAALNQGIEESTGGLVLSLNTDVVMNPDFISYLAGALTSDPDAGSAGGKLLRFPVGGDYNLIDSVGHMAYRNRLTHNRGVEEIDVGQYQDKEEVFGTSGAAAMYKREMLEDVKVVGEYFDEDFFAFLEDVDLDWRANLRGWRSLYVPEAVAHHRRGGAGYRKSLLVEYHNYKNRFLIMVKNDTGRGILRNLPGILLTDLLKSGALLVRCPRALGSWKEIIRLLPRMWEKRREIRSRHTVPPLEMERRFQPFPYRTWIKKHLFSRPEMIKEAGDARGR